MLSRDAQTDGGEKEEEMRVGRIYVVEWSRSDDGEWHAEESASTRCLSNARSRAIKLSNELHDHPDAALFSVRVVAYDRAGGRPFSKHMVAP